MENKKIPHYSLGAEQRSVQNPILKYVQSKKAEYPTHDGKKKIIELGWKYLSPDQAEKYRQGTTGIILKDIFRNQISKLNSSLVTTEIIEKLISDIERIVPTKEGNMSTWEYLNGIKTVYVRAEKRELNITLIDKDNIQNNTYHITDEFTFYNGSKTIRADLVFIINGIPILIVETKAAHKIQGMIEALNQIKRYHLQCPELFAILQIYNITHIIKYYYSATWNTSEKLLFNWKDEVKGDFETLVKTFFERERIVKLITDYILFTRSDDELNKIILRPHQIRAVEKVIQRIKNRKKHRGLIWHTQGSGKTYTMITVAQKIISDPNIINPIVLMLVDRNELETQLFGNIRSVGIERVHVATSIRNLQKLIKDNTTGLIVSLIHKFDKIPANLNVSKNIFVLVDEAHRTTGGRLGNYLMGALPNAKYIGFTGTPIDKTQYGKGTFITFGKDDPPSGYLDKYDITESIEDGTTVKLNYTLAANDLQVDRDVLDKEFLAISETEGISDIEELNQVLSKAVNLRNMLKNKKRIRKVAKYVANHYKNNVEPMGYKAFMVAVDREACAFYKAELDKLLPPDYSAVVYSSGHNDPEHMKKYHLSNKEEKLIRKHFRNSDKKPKILIVTEKLLTGFDAPILYCMYLDKPMRDHVLLQAIARVNRPYEDEHGRKKPCGFVLDFVGIFDNLEKALAFDSKDIEGVVQDIDILKNEFAESITYAHDEYLSLIKQTSRDKAVELVIIISALSPIEIK